MGIFFDHSVSDVSRWLPSGTCFFHSRSRFDEKTPENKAAFFFLMTIYTPPLVCRTHYSHLIYTEKIKDNIYHYPQRFCMSFNAKTRRGDREPFLPHPLEKH